MTQAVALAQQASTGVSQGFKNRIINGAMTIDQRNAGASSAFGTTGAYTTVDRYQTYNNTSGTATNQQVVDAPAGFYNSLKVTITASATPAAGELFQIQQIIESSNIADFAFGTASARAITLSFWVKSSLTGQFGGSIQDASAAYGYPFSYTISAANTWERKSISITGATAGSWGATVSAGLRLYFDLGCGSNYLGTAGAWAASDTRGATGDTKLISTNGATWFMTGLQLEVGSTATSFDARPYQTELNLCYRYYWVLAKGDTAAIGNGCYHGTTQVRSYIPFPVTMRVDPSLISNSGSSYYQIELGGGGSDQFNSFTIYRSAVNGAIIYNSTEVSGTSAAAGTLNGNNASAFVSFTAEL